MHGVAASGILGRDVAPGDADEGAAVTVEEQPRPRRRLLLAAVAVVTGAVLVATGLWLARPSSEPAEPSAAPRPPVTRPTASAEPPPYVVAKQARLKRKPKPKPAPVVAAAPSRLQVPALGIDTAVVGIGAIDGILQPPSNPRIAGWYQYGPRPGADTGGALITAHTVHTGGGVFDDLETLSKGDRVTVRTTAGQVRYAVSGVRIYGKAALAAAADEVFDEGGPGRLVLITCEDWNGRDYESNVIVYASPV